MRKKSKLVMGVGINDADYAVQKFSRINAKPVQSWICPKYLLWSNILKRCYSEGELKRKPTYRGCFICDEWKLFSNFSRWLDTQEWFGMQIDKDILFPGNKVYSPDTCVFISGALNKFLTDSAAARGPSPIGVSWEEKANKFRGYCNDPFAGRLEFLGYFNTADLAHETWRARKHQHACRYADMQTDPRIAAALRIRYLPSKEAR